MSIQLTEYYSKVQNALFVFQGIYDSIYQQSQQITDPDFDASIEWNDILWKIQNNINNLQKAYTIERFQRVSKEQMQSLFSAYINNESPGKIIVGFVHTIREFDTLRLLEIQYGVPWQNILSFNNITVSEFETQTTINIPVPIDLSIRASNDIAVFGDQTGDLILGKDFPNEIAEDTDGDFKVLTTSETIKQGVQNLSVAQQGDLPFYENWGLNLELSEDVPFESVESFIQLRILEGFSIDPRIQAVEVLETVRTQNAVNVTIELRPVQGDNFNISVPLPT
jgi:hypothetical protein